jgi:tetratricopeptide (TPR) repeat protein
VANMSKDVLLSPAERKAMAQGIIDPKTFKDYTTRGDYYFFMGSYPRAGMAYEIAAKLEPTNAIAKFAEAHAAFANGEFSFAAGKLRTALKMEPNWGLFNFRLEEFFGNRKDMDNRIGDLEHLVAMRPEDGNAKLLLGYVYYFDGRYGEAVKLLSQVANQPEFQVADGLLKLARLQS